MSAEVQRCGLCIMLKQSLFCIPDGLVHKGTEASLLDVKYPDSCREKQIVNVEEQILNVLYLVVRENELLLENSRILHAIQVLLYVLWLEKRFSIYSCGLEVFVEVEADKDFLFLCTSIPHLQKFYFAHHLPAITKTLRAVCYHFISLSWNFFHTIFFLQ